MSFYKPKPDAIEKYSKDLSDLLAGKTPKEKNSQQSNRTILDYDSIEIEYENREENKKKIKFSHIGGKIRILNNYFTDHLPIDWHMKIKIDRLEDTLPQEMEEMGRDLFYSSNEWVRELIEIKDDKIFIYDDDNNLNLSTDYYHYPKNPNYRQSVKSYELSNKNERLGLDVFNDIETVSRISPELITRLYSRPFEQLPQIIKKEGKIHLPNPGIILALHVNKFPDRYVISSKRGFYDSRGYKLK